MIRSILMGASGNDDSNIGIIWTYRSALSTAWGSLTSPSAITWSSTAGFVAAGWGTGSTLPAVAQSSNAVSWTTHSPLSSYLTSSWMPYAAASNSAGMVLIVGSDAESVYSSDGVSWTPGSNSPAPHCLYNECISSIFTSPTFTAATWTGTRFLIVANGYSATSTDGISWGNGVTSNVVADSVNTPVCCSGNASIMLQGGWYTDPFASSTDNGLTWTHTTAIRSGWALSSTANVLAMNWNGSKFLVAGEYNNMATSPDGVTWTNQPGLITAWGSSSTNGTGARKIVWTGKKYVVLGHSGKVATSPDGVTWTNQPNLSSVTGWNIAYPVTDMTYGNKKCAAIGIASGGVGSTAITSL